MSSILKKRSNGPSHLLDSKSRDARRASVDERQEAANSLLTTVDSQQPSPHSGHLGGPRIQRRNLLGKKIQPKLSQRDIVQLTSQLAIMTRSGVDIASALESLVKQSRKPDSQEILGEILEDVMSGMTFSAALVKHESIFGPSYIASVTAGESSGRMWEVMDQLAKLQRGALKLRNTLKTMAAYPIALVAVSSLVVAALVLFVLPQFATVFAQFDAPLPWITRVLIGFSTEMRMRFYIWIPLAALVIGGSIVFLRTPRGKKLKDSFLLSCPGLCDITQYLYIGRVCRLLGLLIQSGVPVLESLELTQKSIQNIHYQKMLNQLTRNVISGNGLGTTLIDAKIVPPSAADMLMTAEETGSLGGAAELIGEYFEEEGEEKLRGLIVLLEPAITIIMGVVVAFVVLAVALPMFDLSNAVQK